MKPYYFCCGDSVLKAKKMIVTPPVRLQSPTNLVLMTMAISDLLTVTFPAPWYLYIFTFGYDDPVKTIEGGFAYEAMMENLPQIFHTASIWLTLALAVQR